MNILRVLIVASLATSCSAQSWDDLANARPVNFDKLLVGTDKMIYIAPQQGKYWIMTEGSFYTDRAASDATIAIWIDHAPYAPYRDPATGEVKGCMRCVLVSRVTGDHTFVPIIGGFVHDAGVSPLQGQTHPLVIAYPNRLVIAVTPVHGGLAQPLQTYTRFTIVEKLLK